MSRRTDRVGGEMREAIQKVLAKGLSDPRIRGLITITKVQVSEDLLRAKVGVSVFPEEKEALTLHGLQAAARYIRREAAELLAIAKMPELRFESDGSIRRQSEVLDALSKVREESESKNGEESSSVEKDNESDIEAGEEGEAS